MRVRKGPSRGSESTSTSLCIVNAMYCMVWRRVLVCTQLIIFSRRVQPVEAIRASCRCHRWFVATKRSLIESEKGPVRHVFETQAQIPR